MEQSSLEKIEREKAIKLLQARWVRNHEVRETAAKIQLKRKGRTKRTLSSDGKRRKDIKPSE